MTFTRFGTALVLAAFLGLSPTRAAASSIEVDVLATAGPWEWTTGGLNSTFAYGPATQDFTSPSVVDLLPTLGLNAGDAVFVLFKGGLTDSFGTGIQTADNSGYNYLSGFKDDAPGSSGEVLPSFYLPGDWGTAQNASDPTVVADLSGVFLNALVGAFTDANGAIVRPFSLGTFTVYNDGSSARLIGFSTTIPTGATRIQFGLNDDIFQGTTNPPDNSGALQVCVAGTDSEVQACVNGLTAAPVPEPASMMLLGSGLAGLAAHRRRRR